MANINLTAAKAKTDEYNVDTLAAASAGATINSKNVVLIPEDASADSYEIDVSKSALFKTVSVSSAYDGDVVITGNDSVANVFYGGGTGTSMFGGNSYLDNNNKLKTVADKFYGGAGSDTFVFVANGGKDAIYNYGDGDTIQIAGWSETNDLSYVDKNGGLTITLSDSADTTVSKNSVFTVDGKTKTATNGFVLQYVDAEGNVVGGVTYGKLPDGVGYGTKSNKQDTTTITLGSGASGTINAGIISSTIKNINASSNSVSKLYLLGNGNANNISVGGGTAVTVDGGSGAKVTNDNLYGNAKASKTTFVINGGKDVIYNYKTGDNIVYDKTAYDGEPTVKASGADITYTLSKDTSFAIKNVLGSAIQINGTIDEENSHTLPTGLVYDSKMAKISIDNDVIRANLPYDLEPIEGNDEIYRKVYRDAEPITIGGSYSTVDSDGESAEIEAPFESTVTMIDLSASSLAAVRVDTSDEEYGSKVTTVKLGSKGGTVIGSATNGQAFTGGEGEDLFVIDVSKIIGQENASRLKSDTVANLGSGDKVSLIGATKSDITFAEKGKNLNVNVSDGEGNTYTIVTISNFDSGTGVTVVDNSGEEKAYGTMPGGLVYATKGNKVDKSGLVANDSLTATAIDAADYGGSTIKNINATAVTKSKSLVITGSDAANNLYAPTAKAIATTLDGTSGNDNLYGASVVGGNTTYIFQAQTKSKKDVIYDYNDGDVIVIDQSLLEADEKTSSLMAEFGVDEDSGSNSLIYSTGKATADGFNDTKADVVVTINKSNTITIKNAAGKSIILADGYDDEGGIGDTYSFGHVIDSSLAYDSKHTAVTLAANAAYVGDIDLSDYSTYYNTVKKVDLTGNTLAAGIYGNSLANEFIAGAAGSTMYGGAALNSGTEEKPKIVATADKLTGGTGGVDYFLYEAGDGKDQFLSFGSEDFISIGSSYGAVSRSDISLTDKKGVLTVAIGGEAVSTVKTDLNYSGNSTFTVTKQADSTPVHFILSGEDGDDTTFTYGDLASAGVTMDTKYASLTVDSTVRAGTIVDAAALNSQPKIIDGKAATAGIVMIGNANADAIYAGSGGSTMFGGTAGTKAVKDQLYGGDGKDYFVYTDQTGIKGKETDIVYNYDSGTDVIVLESLPDSVKADGKTITFTFLGADSKEKVVQSTLVINGTAVDSNMKKFNSLASVQIAVAEGVISEDGSLNFANVGTPTVYNFNTSVTKKVVEWGAEGFLVEETTENNEQFAANVDDYWFTEDAATTDVVSSELDEILDVKGSTANVATQFNADSYFTQVGEDKQASALALAAARHRAQK